LKISFLFFGSKVHAVQIFSKKKPKNKISLKPKKPKLHGPLKTKKIKNLGVSEQLLKNNIAF